MVTLHIEIALNTSFALCRFAFVLTPKSADKSSKRTRRIFSTITISLNLIISGLIFIRQLSYRFGLTETSKRLEEGWDRIERITEE